MVYLSKSNSMFTPFPILHSVNRWNLISKKIVDMILFNSFPVIFFAEMIIQKTLMLKYED